MISNWKVTISILLFQAASFLLGLVAMSLIWVFLHDIDSGDPFYMKVLTIVAAIILTGCMYIAFMCALYSPVIIRNALAKMEKDDV